MVKMRSVGHVVALFHNHLGQHLAQLAGLYLHLALTAVNCHLRLGVNGFKGACDGFFAVAAGHAGYSKNMVHSFSL